MTGIPGAPWHALPAVMLRQAGFGMDLLAGLADPAGVAEAAAMRTHEAQARHWATRLKELFREVGLPDRERASSWLGYLRPFEPETLTELSSRVSEPVGTVLAAYQMCTTALAESWRDFDERHRARLARAAGEVVAAFRADPLLRDALLLSNDANYPLFAAWLADPDAATGKRNRKMVDLLARYLQRFAAKNETHAHFGPISTGRPGDAAGLHWTDRGAGRRAGFAAHWAVEALAESFAARPALRDHVRPRRRPLALADGDRIRVYAPTTRTGLIADWRFEQVADEPLDPRRALLLDRCDGTRTVAELRREWAGPDFDELLADLAARDWLVAVFEIPVGELAPLRALRATLPDAGSGPDAKQAHDVLDRFEHGVAALGAAAPADRARRFAELKDTFTAATGRPANRGGGRMYADRSVYFEECHSRVADLTYGPDIGAVLTRELAPFYDLLLAGPRLRLAAERTILAGWVTRRFGAGRQVPLGDFYAAYIADRADLDAECAAVDEDLAALDARLVDALLADGDLAAHEIEVRPERLAAVLDSAPTGEPAVCNPDILLAAGSAAALGRGEFTIVLGEVHAVRELLCHSSMAPLMAESIPDLAQLAYAAYQDLLDPDEVLCDLARSHPNKTGLQVSLPIGDLEITGRSGRPRAEVLQPADLFVTVRAGRPELRTARRPGRLRLLTAPAGGPSIRQDPLAPFAFPRHFGGVPLAARELAHVPRIRCGRVILRRESWQVPAGRLRGVAPGGGRRNGDAAEFAAVQLARAELGLPRHVFVRVAGEPKPIYVDLDSPLLVRQMCRLVRDAGHPLQISEMMPAPEALWLRLDGHGVTTELRYAVFSRTPTS
jgi:lantibiotic biosynthesis dehydratase-like protein